MASDLETLTKEATSRSPRRRWWELSAEGIKEAAKTVGIRVPNFCYHPDLPWEGSCRMCLAQVNDWPKLTTTCTEVVRDGMVVEFGSEKAVKARTAQLEFLLVNHPLDCPICDQAGECKLRDYYFEHGQYLSRMMRELKVHKKKVVDLGLLDETEQGVKGLSYADLLWKLMKKAKGDNLKKDLAAYLKIDEDSEPIRRFEWLGLLGDEMIRTEKSSPLDVFADRLLEKLEYEEGERDMIVLHHDFRAEYPQNRKEKITSTLVDYGIPNGDSSMSRTVGLPAAIGATLILNGKIKETGVHIPVSPTIYEPALDELEKLGIVCKEKTESL